MDENTFQDAGVVSVINESFTAVKFNAETTSPVTYNGKTYNFVKTGARGANQLALDLGSVGGKLGYPTLIILDENGNKLQAFPGFKDVETLGMILKFYKSGSYKTMDFQQFQSGQ
jgi:thioredoxin-related protein